MGDIPVNMWFGKYEGSVFIDDGGGDPTKAANGFRDPNEMGLINQVLNLRYRDGSMYQTTTSQPPDGHFSFDEVFPFFKWLVAEVDYTRFKDTGMTTVIDNGGAIPADDGWDMPSDGKRNPQPQVDELGNPIINPNTGNNLSRTQVSTFPSEVLLEAFMLFADQDTRIDWGKLPYSGTENGGIVGITYYATTRTENDPRYRRGRPLGTGDTEGADKSLSGCRHEWRNR